MEEKKNPAMLTTVLFSKEEVCDALQYLLKKRGREVQISSTGPLGFLAVDQPEDEECWISYKGVEVSFDTKE